MVYRVFLSSTSQDLAAHREAVLAAIAGLDGFAPIAMENFGARAEAAVDFDDRKVRDSHVLVGLLGLCYGSSPRDGPPSFTEREYDSAIAGEIRRLMLVSPDDFPVAGHLIEPDAQREHQQAFRARVKVDLIADVSAAAFASPEALARAVTQALANWRADREKAEEIVAELVATREVAARHEARAAELEQALAEGQKEREALRAAVMALTGKAREADAPSGVEQALELLRQGQTAEAEAIFAEVVARKEEEGTRQQAEGLAALREAAEAARHRGALAYLDDTRKAIDAYSTATRLDPDHTWSWISLGLLYQQAGSLARAEPAFAQAQAAAKRTGDHRDQSIAQAYLGDVRMAQGNLSEALAAYEVALSVHQSLVDRHPDDTERQRDLSVSQEKIGDVLVAQGKLAPALDSYRASLAIRERLAQADPGNAGWQRDLGISNERIGDVFLAQGNLTEALSSYERKYQVISALAQADPGNAGWQRDLIVSNVKLAEIAGQAGQSAAARGHYQSALEIATDLLESGRLAPVDAWMVDALEARLAALPGDTAGR